MALKYPTGESLTGYLDSKIDTSIALGDSDNKIPTQKAVKEYVDNKIDIPGNLTPGYSALNNPLVKFSQGADEGSEDVCNTITINSKIA